MLTAEQRLHYLRLALAAPELSAAAPAPQPRFASHLPPTFREFVLKEKRLKVKTADRFGARPRRLGLFVPSDRQCETGPLFQGRLDISSPVWTQARPAQRSLHPFSAAWCWPPAWWKAGGIVSCWRVKRKSPPPPQRNWGGQQRKPQKQNGGQTGTCLSSLPVSIA